MDRAQVSPAGRPTSIAMCGIAGVVFGDCAEEKALQALHAIGYRGSVWGGLNHPGHAFYAVRLPRFGNRERAQPVVSPRGNVLVLNGEIYNAAELASSIGVEPVTDLVDTELLAAWLDDKGIDGLSALDGEYSLAWYEVSKGALHLARDPLGTHPLYYSDSNGRVAFASSAKSAVLLACRDVRVDAEAASDFLWFGVSVDGSAVWGAHRVEPAEVVTFRRDRKARRKKIEVPQIRSEDLLKRLRLGVEQRVSSASRAFLAFSGGIDSSLIASVWPPGPCARYRLTGGGRSGDRDSTFVRVGAESLAGALEALAPWAERPLTSLSGPAFYLLCRRAASDGYEVRLGGEGADEIFLGYPHYFGLEMQNHPFLRTKDDLRSVVMGLLGISASERGTALMRRHMAGRNRDDWNAFDRKIRLPEHLNTVNNDIPALLAGVESRCPYLTLSGYRYPTTQATAKADLVALALQQGLAAPPKEPVFFGCRILPPQRIRAMAKESEECNVLPTPAPSSSRVAEILEKCASVGRAADLIRETVSAYVVGRWSLGRSFGASPAREYLPNRFTELSFLDGRCLMASDTASPHAPASPFRAGKSAAALR